MDQHRNKSCKSIVKVRFTETMPRTAWAVATPSEYGFYANVNPRHDHPRWSQATEQRIGFNAEEKRRLVDLDYNYFARNDAALKEWWDKSFKG